VDVGPVETEGKRVGDSRIWPPPLPDGFTKPNPTWIRAYYVRHSRSGVGRNGLSKEARLPNHNKHLNKHSYYFFLLSRDTHMSVVVSTRMYNVSFVLFDHVYKCINTRHYGNFYLTLFKTQIRGNQFWISCTLSNGFNWYYTARERVVTCAGPSGRREFSRKTWQTPLHSTSHWQKIIE
jgi:hypothetical protein